MSVYIDAWLVCVNCGLPCCWFEFILACVDVGLHWWLVRIDRWLALMLICDDAWFALMTGLHSCWFALMLIFIGGGLS